MLLHTPTLLRVSLMLAITMGLIMGLVARRERHDGLVWWAWAMVPLALMLLLFSLRGQISDGWSVVLGNTLLIAVLALFAEGLCEFQQRAPRRALIWGAVAATPVLMVLFLERPLLRPLATHTVLCLEAVLLLWLVLERRSRTAGRGQYLVLAGLLLAALATLARLLLGLLGVADFNQVTSSDTPQALSMLAFPLIIILVTMGLVMMTKERADALNRTLALQDELTGLHNRRAVLQQLEQQLALARRNGRPLALLIVDIDHFKRINDEHGHLIGDQALRAMAQGLQGRLRAQDIAGRWGGEEFLVVLPGTDADGARALAETLRRCAEQSHLAAQDGRCIRFTVSIGLHAPDPARTGGREEMLAAADRALYQAKQAGRNRVAVL